MHDPDIWNTFSAKMVSMLKACNAADEEMYLNTFALICKDSNFGRMKWPLDSELIPISSSYPDNERRYEGTGKS